MYGTLCSAWCASAPVLAPWKAFAYRKAIDWRDTRNAPTCAHVGSGTSVSAVQVPTYLSHARIITLGWHECLGSAGSHIPFHARVNTLGAGAQGKAAIDVVCNPLGKSGGSAIQQLMIIGFGSLAASTPYLGAILLAVVLAWLGAASSLNKQARPHAALAHVSGGGAVVLVGSPSGSLQLCPQPPVPAL